MAPSFTYVPYIDTGYFSHLVTDYLAQHQNTQPFYSYTPDRAGIEKAISDRAAHPVNRQLLVDTLTQQYASLKKTEKTSENIRLLLSDNTYTICTAHQPNLLTGYLYFVYKILHAIKLAEELKAQHPSCNFVPVYYMGSEDNDLEELGAFRFRGDKYIWEGDGQKGAVGRMATKGLKPMLQELFKVFGPPGKCCDELQEMITKAYTGHATIGAATQYLVNELFGRFGLVIIDPDAASLKAAFISVMKDELLNQASYPVVSGQIELLSTRYKIQAYPRPINLFYLTDQLRERIERNHDKWVVVNTDIEWTEQEVLDELNAHPERFSPNVVLRGLFQETILPNVAFIGGGAEVAYWLQLKTLFEHYGIFFPAILLRQSVMWVPEAETQLRNKLELEIPGLFGDEDEQVRTYIAKHSDADWQTTGEAEAMTAIFQTLEQKAISLDPTLKEAAGAALTKMKRQLHVLEQKMLRAQKRKMDVQVQRISRLKNKLFPGGGLQERVENFTEYYLEYGPAFFDTVKEGILPLSGQFLVVEKA